MGTEWEKITRQDYHRYFRVFAESANNKTCTWEKEIVQPPERDVEVISKYNGKPKLKYVIGEEIEYFKIQVKPVD